MFTGIRFMLIKFSFLIELFSNLLTGLRYVILQVNRLSKRFSAQVTLKSLLSINTDIRYGVWDT